MKHNNYEAERLRIHSHKKNKKKGTHKKKYECLVSGIRE